MLTSLAWKNIWRSPKRSGIIIAAITFGLWGGLLAGGVMMGWGESMVNSAIDRDLGHIQIHRPGFTRDRGTNNYIPGAMNMLGKIRSVPGVVGVAGRTIIDGIAASPTSTFGVQISGADPEQARKVTRIDGLIVEGEYLSDKGRNPVVVGRKLAERLNLKLKSKLVLSFQAMDSSMISAAFRVRGIYKSESSPFDESHVFVNRDDLTRLLGGETAIHEIAVRVESAQLLPQVLTVLKSDYPTLAVESWKEIAPEVALTASSMAFWSYIFVGIILLALVFGITNTMLMAVMERTRELGILIAVGMKRSKVFRMILLETGMLSLTGGVGGMLCGWITIGILAHTGLDFSAFAASLESFGASAVLYPFLPLQMYIVLVVMIIVAATIGATLPAWKAVHLMPSRAIRD